jgi:hypothetical protein
MISYILYFILLFQFCTASWRKRDALQIWDYGSSKLIKAFEPAPGKANGLHHKLNKFVPSQMNYSCKYFDENRIVVGGTQDDAVSLINIETSEVRNR